MFSNKLKAAVLLPLVTAAGSAMAQTTGTDYSAITGAVDWTTVSAGIITIFAAGATVIVAFVGGKFLLRAIRGA